MRLASWRIKQLKPVDLLSLSKMSRDTLILESNRS
jgi:hypothetical protein